MMPINIAMITDNNYVKNAITAVTSIALNVKSISTDNIYILVNNVSKENVELFKLCQKQFENIRLNIVDCSNYSLKLEAIKESRHVTKSAIIKFFIPDILSDLDKVLYLDCDIIVQKDLSELYNTDLNRKYAAVVKDTVSLSVGKDYFNSGVMLLNLKKMREDDIPQKLLNQKLSQDTFYMDQDALNEIIGNNVKYVSCKNNFLNIYLDNFSIDELSKLFQEQLPTSPEEIYKNCVIIHLAGPLKAWKYDLGYCSELFKNYWNKSIFANKPLKLKRCAPCSLLQTIFSIKNTTDKKYKVISVLGIKIYISRRSR